MPSNEPKLQHYVQRAYLEAFCDPKPNEKTGKPFLWVHTANRPVRRQVPKECAAENYFYCYEEDGKRSFRGEKFLGDLEAASASVLRAAQQGELPTTVADRYKLTGYTAMALTRTPVAKRLIDQATIDNAVQQIRELVSDPVRHAEFCKQVGIDNPEESIRKLKGGRVRGVQTNRAWSLRQMVDLMLKFQDEFMRMNLFLLHANDAFFLTSDSPVIVHDPAKPLLLPHGALSPDLLFPLSREFCLAGTPAANPGLIELADPQVLALNRRLVRQADRFVYAPFDSSEIQAELQAVAEARLRQPDDNIIEF
jgi:Protein of unknown function (DUF4238)